MQVRKALQTTEPDRGGALVASTLPVLRKLRSLTGAIERIDAPRKPTLWARYPAVYAASDHTTKLGLTGMHSGHSSNHRLCSKLRTVPEIVSSRRVILATSHLEFV